MSVPTTGQQLINYAWGAAWGGGVGAVQYTHGGTGYDIAAGIIGGLLNPIAGSFVSQITPQNAVNLADAITALERQGHTGTINASEAAQLQTLEAEFQQQPKLADLYSSRPTDHSGFFDVFFVDQMYEAV